MAQYDTDPNDEGKRLITGWQAAVEAARVADDQLVMICRDKKDVTNRLGAWLCPADAAPGEAFCIWYGDNLIQATKLHDGNYEVKLRHRGKRGL